VCIKLPNECSSFIKYAFKYCMINKHIVYVCTVYVWIINIFIYNTELSKIYGLYCSVIVFDHIILKCNLS